MVDAQIAKEEKRPVGREANPQASHAQHLAYVSQPDDLLQRPVTKAQTRDRSRRAGPNTIIEIQVLPVSGPEPITNLGLDQLRPSLSSEIEYTPQRYAEFARQWKEMGAQVIGGCCATGPEHIGAVRSALKG